jgi:general secretion pathway protein D
VNLAAPALANGATAGAPTLPGKGLNLGVFRQVNGQLTLGALARALETDEKANILSMPNLITLDNEEAKIVVGQNVPFVTGQFTGATGGVTANPFQTIERKDVGLSLRVRPQISQGGSVKLAIYQETSSVRPTTNASDIITDKRSIDTNVLVDDGQVIVLGGLIDDSGSDNVEKVPVLGSIPLVGNLFKYQSRARSKRNLMVFLRPTIVRTSEQSVNLASDRYGYMKDVQVNVEPDRTLLLPNLGAGSLPNMHSNQLVDGPLYNMVRRNPDGTITMPVQPPAPAQEPVKDQ